MTNDPRYQHLLELNWRRKLTPSEEAELQACLEAHSQAQAGWEAEAALTEALGRLPDAPVPSNFTARVLQAAEREAALQGQDQTSKWRRWPASLQWLPKVAFAAIALGAGLLSYHEASEARRSGFLTGVETVSRVSSLPSPEILQDFDAIRALNRTPPA